MAKRTKATQAGGRQQTRNTERLMISLYPDDVTALDEVAARIAEPGAEPNRSQAVRRAIREFRSRLLTQSISGV